MYKQRVYPTHARRRRSTVELVLRRRIFFLRIFACVGYTLCLLEHGTQCKPGLGENLRYSGPFFEFWRVFNRNYEQTTSISYTPRPGARSTAILVLRRRIFFLRIFACVGYTELCGVYGHNVSQG